VRRPLLGPELDPSRAAERAADPRSWRLDDAARAALATVIDGRRDVRRFRPDPVDDEVLERVLEAAHRAPSVGLSQPWRFVVVRATETRARVRALAERERARQAPRFGARARAFLDQKVEGVLEAPIGVCVCCVAPPAGTEVLGRSTIPATDIYSTACAIQNLWLTARAEGLGVGWVSFYRPEELRAVLGIPDAVEPVAWLCVGWPDERPLRPGLERAGWAKRRPLAEVLYDERWPAGDEPPTGAPRPPASRRATGPTSWSSRPGAWARWRTSWSAGAPPRARRRRRPCAPPTWSSPPTTDTPRAGRACSRAPSPARWRPRPPAARRPSASSRARAKRPWSSPTSACAVRPRPAASTAAAPRGRPTSSPVPP
jgi:nicotinate-nucleotide--dimethylbenzimidazole phosphoribosyltransferase